MMQAAWPMICGNALAWSKAPDFALSALASVADLIGTITSEDRRTGATDK